jgi:hypothetical protein
MWCKRQVAPPPTIESPRLVQRCYLSLLISCFFPSFLFACAETAIIPGFRHKPLFVAMKQLGNRSHLRQTTQT